MNALNSTSACTNTVCPVCGGQLDTNDNATYKHCPICGYNETLIIGDIDPIIRHLEHDDMQVPKKVADPAPSVSVGGMYGWICPKCGAVLSPFTSCCPNCTKSNWEITCSTNTASNDKNFDVQQFLGGKDKWGFK